MDVNNDIKLFAEDVVSHFMNKLMFQNTPYCNISVAPTAGQFRSSVYNGFTDNIRKAVDIIYDRQCETIRRKFKEKEVQNDVNYIWFHEYGGEFLLKNYVGKGVDSILLLKYCVRVAVLAKHFFKYGYIEAPDKAADYIARCFLEVNMDGIEWKNLNLFAVDFVKHHMAGSGSSASIPQQEHSDLNPDSSCEDCPCFTAVIAGDSFKKIYVERERVKTFHDKFQCYKKGSDKRISPKLTSKPGIFKKYVSRADSSAKSPEAPSSKLIYEGECSEGAIQQLPSFDSSNIGNEQSPNPQPQLSADSLALRVPKDEEILNPQDDSGALSGRHFTPETSSEVPECFKYSKSETNTFEVLRRLTGQIFESEGKYFNELLTAIQTFSSGEPVGKVDSQIPDIVNGVLIKISESIEAYKSNSSKSTKESEIPGTSGTSIETGTIGSKTDTLSLPQQSDKVHAEGTGRFVNSQENPQNVTDEYTSNQSKQQYFDVNYDSLLREFSKELSKLLIETSSRILDYPSASKEESEHSFQATGVTPTSIDNPKYDVKHNIASNESLKDKVSNPIVKEASAQTDQDSATGFSKPNDSPNEYTNHNDLPNEDKESTDSSDQDTEDIMGL